MGAGVLCESLSMVCLHYQSRSLWDCTARYFGSHWSIWYSLQDYLHYLCVIATSLSVLYLLYKRMSLLCPHIKFALANESIVCCITECWVSNSKLTKNKQWCNVMMYRQLMCECCCLWLLYKKWMRLYNVMDFGNIVQTSLLWNFYSWFYN